MTAEACPLGLGTPNGYSNRGCRCADCRAAWRAYQAASVTKRAFSRAQSQAAKWVRDNEPGVWFELYREQIDRARAEARKAAS